jgi:hypothetical protein
MESEEIKAILEQVVKTVGFVCEETANLVSESATRVDKHYVAEVRRKSDAIRASGRSLLATLGKDQQETGLGTQE